jgi:Zn-dependent protease with chaperone function
MDIYQMQGYVNSVLAQQGILNQWVLVVPTRDTIAAAIGATLDRIDLLIIKVEGKTSAGIIYVNVDLVNRFFDENEIKFILAHECSHILKSHVISKAFWVYLESILNGERNENKLYVDALKLLLAIFSPEKLPPNALALRNNEYEADEYALKITGNKGAALRVLKKLAGKDMDGASHTWEFMGKELAAMSYRERIAELEIRTARFLP